MTGLIFTILYLFLFYGFTIISIKKFGVPSSHSEFYYDWYGYTTHPIWEMVNFFSALLLMIAMKASVPYGSLWWIIGTIAPCFLVGVMMVPCFRRNALDGFIHTTCAILCAALTIAYIIFGLHAWWTIIVSVLTVFFTMWLTEAFKEKDTWTWWFEQILFYGIAMALLSSNLMILI